jgi:hypothetical protein
MSMTDQGATMTYTETTGDLFELGLPAIGHGCNTVGSMAGGIARDVKRRWPECYREYAERCRDGRFALGGFHAWEGDGIVVYNLATQVRPGKDARPDAHATGILWPGDACLP